MKLCKSVILTVILVVLIIPVQPVRADIAPPPAPGLGGLRPFTYQSTEVQLVYERVELTLHTLIPPNDYGWVQEQIDATAWFVLHNTGGKDEEMKAAFPLGNLNRCVTHARETPGNWGLQEAYIIPESFKVSKDGAALETQITEIAGIDCVGWATFDVHFPVNKDVLIKVDYSMQTNGRGRDLLFQYVLETGAGWKGPIKQAYIIVRFPYLVTNENVDASLTTPGYQSLYNEIFWSYRDLEPTLDDNIDVAFFEPRTWADILVLRERVARIPTDTDAWSKLLDKYAASYNRDKIIASFETAIQSNPNNADLHARYAYFLQSKCCYFLSRGSSDLPLLARENANKHVIPLLNRAFALDLQNQTALEVLQGLQWVFPNLTYTPPPTIPSTATPLVSSTPTVMLLPSSTPSPSWTPNVIKVIIVQTRIVTATPASTASPSSPPLSSTSTPTASSTTDVAPALNWLVWPLLLLAGFVGGVFVSRKKRT